MKHIILGLTFLFACGTVSAQDYFVTKDRNKSSFKVNKITEVQNILKVQGKSDKYQFVLLSFSNGEGVFTLVPVNFDKELSLDGLSLTDKKDEDYYIDISIKDSSAKPQEDVAAFKKEVASGGAKMVSEQDVIINTRKVKEMLFSMASGRQAYAYMIDYKKNILFITQGTKDNIKERSMVVKRIIAALGLVQTADGSASPKAEQTASAAAQAPVKAETAQATLPQPSAKTQPAEPENPAINVMKQAGLSTAQDVEDTDIQSLKVTPAGSAANKISFKYNGLSYSLSAPAQVKATLEDGRIYFATPRRGKNILFLEVPGTKSKTFYASILKTYGEGHVLKPQKATDVKLGANSVRVLRKAALNKAANNYFFKQNSSFVISYIADSKDDIYFDTLAKSLITSFKAD